MGDEDNVYELVYRVNREEAIEAQAEELESLGEIADTANEVSAKGGAAATREGATRRRATADSLNADQTAGRTREDLQRRQTRRMVEALTEEQLAHKKALAAKLAAEQAAAKAMLEAQRRSSEQMGMLNAAGGKVFNVFSMILSASTGFAGIASLISMVADSFERAKAQALEAGKFVISYKEALKEIAFLKGTSGPTGTIVKEDLAFRSKTLQDQAGARGVQEEFRNFAGVSTDTKDTKRKISQEDAEKAMIFAGQQQSMYGGEGGAYGKLAGIIPSMDSRQRLTGDDVSQRFRQLMMLGQGGSASPSQFANQIAGSASLVTTGAYKDMARMAAVGTTISTETPGEISTGLDQIHRLTKAGLVDVSMPPGADMSPSAYLGGIGANDQMDDAEILEKMFQDIEAQEKISKAQGKTLDMTGYLKGKGYGNADDIKRFSQVYGRRSDLRNTFMPQAGGFDPANGQFMPNLPGMAEANRPFNEFKSSEQGMQQQSRVTEDRSKFAQGAGAQEYYQALEKQAFALASARGDITGSYDELKGSARLSGYAGNLLREEGVKKGLPFNRRYSSGGSGGVSMVDPLEGLMRGAAGSKERADQFYAVAQQVTRAGGSAMGDNTDAMKRFNESMDKSAKFMEDGAKALMGINDKLNPPPVAAVKPGGANARPAR